MNQRSKVAIVILNYNTWELTIEMVKQLHETEIVNSSMKIVVVDNHSTNDSVRNISTWIEKNGGKEILIKNDKNAGYAAGNNVGIRWAVQKGYEYSWICNNDLILCDTNVLKNMVSVLENEPSVAAVSPRVIDFETRRELNRNLKRLSVWDMSLGNFIRRINRIVTDQEEITEGWCECYRPQGCCMLLRNSAMVDVNYMDESTFLYSEELILAERFFQKKWKCACALNTRIIHNHGRTVQQFKKKLEVYKIRLESGHIYYNYRGFTSFERLLCDVGFTLRYICEMAKEFAINRRSKEL